MAGSEESRKLRKTKAKSPHPWSRVRLTQPVKNAGFLLHLAPFGTGSFTTLPLTLAPLARVCSPNRNRFAPRTPSSPRVFGSSFPLGILRKAITGGVGTRQGPCPFGTTLYGKRRHAKARKREGDAEKFLRLRAFACDQSRPADSKFLLHRLLEGTGLLPTLRKPRQPRPSRRNLRRLRIRQNGPREAPIHPALSLTLLPLFPEKLRQSQFSEPQ